MALNDSLEALKDFFSEFVETAARMTKNAATVTKSNINIFTEQEKQKKAYLELGKLYYRDFITGEEPDDAEYLPLCDAITEAAKNIEALRCEAEEAKADFGKSAKDAADAEAEDLETELDNLNKELDELEKDLSQLNKVEEKVEEVEKAVEAVFEVVDDAVPTEESKPEE